MKNQDGTNQNGPQLNFEMKEYNLNPKSKIKTNHELKFDIPLE